MIYLLFCFQIDNIFFQAYKYLHCTILTFCCIYIFSPKTVILGDMGRKTEEKLLSGFLTCQSITYLTLSFFLSISWNMLTHHTSESVPALPQGTQLLE